MEPSGFGVRLDGKTVAEAFTRVHDGYSADRVVADVEMNKEFLVACANLGLSAAPKDLNRALINLRKTGGLLPKTTRQTSFDDDPYRFASDIAIRILERRDGVTLDDVICDPVAAEEFDRIAASLVPGFSSLQYRWAALTLRKERNLRPEVATHLLRPEKAHLVKLCDLVSSELPRLPGIYAFLDTHSKRTLYIGEAANLRSRLGTHVDHSDNKLLARHLWEHGVEQIQVEYYVLPEHTSKRELRAIEAEQIRQRRPPFNISGMD
jgi:site-specific DNA-methyltransferase (adenine-specific)